MKGYIVLSSLVAMGATLPIDITGKSSDYNSGKDLIAGNGVTHELNIVGTDVNDALDATGKGDLSGAINKVAQGLQDLGNAPSNVGGVSKRSELDELLVTISDTLAGNQKRSTEAGATTLGDGARGTVGTAYDGVNDIADNLNDAIKSLKGGDAVSAAGSIGKAIVALGSGTVETVASAGDGVGSAASETLSSSKRSELDELLATISDTLAGNQKRSTEAGATTLGDGARGTVGTAYDGVNNIAEDLNNGVNSLKGGDAVSTTGDVGKAIVDLGSGIVETVASAGDGVGSAASETLSSEKRAIEAVQALI